MPTSPESSSRHTPSNSDLKAGLAAFKQKNYPAAIALLEAVLLEDGSSRSPDSPLKVQAQMALAIAYERLGETVQATQICQSLAQSTDPQAQVWGRRTLATLAKRHPEQSNLKLQPPNPTPEVMGDRSGFTPLDPSAQNPAETPIAPIASTEIDRSGFVPLSSSPTGNNAARTSKAQPITTYPKTQPKRSIDLPPARLSSQTPSEPSSEPTSHTVAEATPETYQPHWRLAGRASHWKALGKVNPWRLIAVEIVTVVGLFWVVQQLIHRVFGFYGYALNRLIPSLGFRWVLWGEPNWSYAVSRTILLIAFLASPWILDGLLKFLYRLKPFSLDALATYSPETARSLPQFCRKQNLPVPTLQLLPTQAPVIFSYGLPWLTRTVVSQGLLEQLADAEIATLFANEIGHLAYWDIPIMSMTVVLLQVPYTLYKIAAEWGNRKQASLSRLSAGLVAGLSYGVFRLLRWVGLWFSRQRTYYSDRVAVDLTGNPNGYTRALLKLAIGTANHVQEKGQTPDLLEAFELLIPLGHRMATTLGSFHAHTPLEPILEQERQNPYRHWLGMNQTHPPTGERLHLLALYAHHWQLPTELNWQNLTPQRRKQVLTGQQWQMLLLQGAPYVGLATGLGLAWGLSRLGFLGLRANLDLIAWMARDRTLSQGLPLIGFAIGTFIRINSNFPEIQPSLLKSRLIQSPLNQPFQASPANPSSASEPTLPNLIGKTPTIPCQGQIVRLEGTLLGRPGIYNGLNQDLLLKTATGIVRLHCTSWLGPLGNLLPQQGQPNRLLGKDLTATGWLRRGATPWIDVETLRTMGGLNSTSNHPLWSTLVAATCAIAGIFILLDF
jgi:Zn-dependent protease with chaperone function